MSPTFPVLPVLPVRRFLATVLLLSFAGAPRALQAGTPLPFPPEWKAVLEETFFAQGELSIEKLDRYRQHLQQRQVELANVLIADYRDRGKKDRSIRRRLKNKKDLILYRTLLGDGEQLGMLGQLWDESDPVQARVIASQILELDYALLIEGERPFSLELVDYLSWAWLWHWVIEDKPHADQVDREATNLWDPERELYYEPYELAAMIERGEDISALNPAPGSSFWQPGVPIAERSVRTMFYEGGADLHAGRHADFPEHRARLDKIRLSQTKPKFEIEVRDGESARTFKLKVGGEIHSEPTVNALLATLGFNIDLTFYVRDFRLDLDDEESVEAIRHEWRSYFENRRTHNRFSFDDYFDEGIDAEGPYLIVREGVLEWKPPEILRTGPWPYGGNGNNGRREVRGLGVFSAWVGNTDLKEAENNKLAMRRDEPPGTRFYHMHHDLGHSLGRMIREQLDAYPWELVDRTPSGRIKLNYHSVQANSLRTMITWADARWMTREIAQLSKRQIAQAVAIGHWPRGAAMLLTEKLTHRRNELVVAFDLVGEPSRSGPIELLEVDRSLTTHDGTVQDGELVTGRFEGSTQEFDNYFEELLGPVWDRTLIFLMSQIQRSVSAVPEIVFDERSVGFPKGLIAELLINFKRSTAENERPTSSKDYYVTYDSFLLGARIGGGFVGRGEAAYYRQYSLITPAGTEGEAQYADDTIFNLLLPWQVHRGDLPTDYVLVREDFLEGRGRVITDDISGGSAVVGAEATLARVRLARDVVAVRGDQVRAYRDVSVFDEAAFRAFLKAVFVRIPLASYANRRGDRHGELYELTESFANTPEPARAALQTFIRSGDSAGLDAVADRIEIATEFQYYTQKLGILDFIASGTGREREDVILRDALGSKESLDAFRQLRVYGRSNWKWIDFKESYRWSAQTVTSADTTTPPAILLQFVDSDGDTWSSEFGDSYLGFINGVAGAGDPDSRQTRTIQLTPSLHSVNDRWGHLTSRVDVGFQPDAVEALIALPQDEYWDALARRLELTHSQLRHYRSHLMAQGKERMTRARQVPYRERRAVRHSLEMLRHLRLARADADPASRYGHVVEALAATAFRLGGGFDPRVLAVLREQIGEDSITVDARITQPVWKEKRLPGRADVVLHTHSKPAKLKHAPVLFAPRGPVQTYEMLDSFDPLVRRAQQAASNGAVQEELPYERSH